MTAKTTNASAARTPITMPAIAPPDGELGAMDAAAVAVDVEVPVDDVAATLPLVGDTAVFEPEAEEVVLEVDDDFVDRTEEALALVDDKVLVDFGGACLTMTHSSPFAHK